MRKVVVWSHLARVKSARWRLAWSKLVPVMLAAINLVVPEGSGFALTLTLSQREREIGVSPLSEGVQLSAYNPSLSPADP